MSSRGLAPLFAGELYTGDVKYSPRKGKNLAISQSMWAVGLERPGWRFSVFQKQDAWLEIEEKTLDVLTANMAGRSLPNGQGLPVGVQFAGYEATGIKVEKAFAFQGLGHQSWALGLGVSAFMGNSLRLTEANGSVQPTSTGYLFNVNTNDSASNATYPYIRDAKVSAEGYALDAGATYRLNAQQTLGLAVNDAFSSVVWRNMPNSQLAINNQQVGKDANGFVKPSLTGMNDVNRRDIMQTLEPKYQIDWVHTGTNRRWRVVGQSMRSHTMAGVRHGVRLIGANCGRGTDEMRIIASELADAKPADVHVFIQSNAGLPQLVGADFVYTGTPAEMGEFALEMKALGINAIGSCCGSTHEHTAAIAGALKS